MYRIFLFGPPRFEQDGIQIKISRRKSIAVLAYLATSGEPHSREILSTLCYPDFDQVGARNNMRRDIFELKTSLGGRLLRIERQLICLNSQAELWLDVKEFQAQLAKAHQHGHFPGGRQPEPLCADCQVGLEEAVDLYTADFMAGFHIPGSREFEEWQFFEAEKYRQLLREALQLLAGWHDERAEFEPAIAFTRRWLALDHYHEPAHRQLMRLLAWSGQQSAALKQYEECVRLLHQELHIEPDEETSALYEAIRNRQITSRHPESLKGNSLAVGANTAGKIPHNLPPMASPLVGRRSELAQITSCLRDDPACRLITLMGPGGIGKTHLSIDAASLLADDPDCPFCDGIWFVPLASLAGSASITQPISEALKLPLLPDPEQRLQQLFDYIQSKNLLLILDNFEQLISDQNIQLLIDLLAHAPNLKLLVTSRTRLKAHFEQVVTLSGLDFPQSEAECQSQPVEQIIASYSALELFLQRARRLKPDFELTACDIQPVAQICQMLEGLPLGIELAAAWLEVLTPAEILTEIEECLDFLVAEWPDMPERHHSLRAVFDSSWRLLSEPERGALMALTVFPGSFSRQAAQAVSGASIHILLALQNKSWLHYQNNGRYQIHDMLCQYASEKLQADPGSWQLAKERYGAYYAAFMDKQSAAIKSQKQKEALNAIASEFDNISLAWQWLVEDGKVESVVHRMLLAAFCFAEARAKSFELAQWIDLALLEMEKQGGLATPKHLKAILLTARASFNIHGNPVRLFPSSVYVLEDYFHQAWRIAGKTETLKTMGFWGILLIYLYGDLVNNHQAAEYLREILLYFREQKSDWELANALYILGTVLMINWRSWRDQRTTLEESKQILLEALAVFQKLGYPSGSGFAWTSLGNLYSHQGKYEQAIEQWQTAQKHWLEVGDWLSATHSLYSIAYAYMDLGDFQSAFHNLHMISQEFFEIGHRSGAASGLSWESINALRFSTIEHARQTRQECLRLYHELGNESGEAWATWEMGEINRLAGDLPMAQEWFEKARSIFERIDDKTFLIFYYRGLGDIAQASQDFDGAKKYFMKSLQQAKDNNHLWGMAYALCGLGRAEVALNQPNAAQEIFSQALIVAREIGSLELSLVSLAGFANVFNLIGKVEQAVELASLVLNHPLGWNETKDQISLMLQSVKNLPADQLNTALERGRLMDVGTTISQLAH